MIINFTLFEGNLMLLVELRNKNFFDVHELFSHLVKNKLHIKKKVVNF